MHESNEGIRDRRQSHQHKKLQGIEFPESNESEIIIRCRPSFYGYQLLKKNYDLLKDISNIQINETIAKINKMIDLNLIDKKLEENEEFKIPNLWLMRIFAITGVLLAFVMYILVVLQVPTFSQQFIYIPLTAILVLVIICLALLVKGLLKGKNDKNYDILISKGIDRIIKKENELHYNSKGYLMEKQENLYWLSLRKVF